MLAACATPPAADPLPPIVFVHGNGDSAALWMTTLWRFESNGWPRERLLALDFPYPLARDVDAAPQPGRSGTAESMQFLSAEVDRLLRATGASRVVLIANSRGGNAVRLYIASGGGAATVSHAILCGTPNHGVWADPTSRTGHEFNGAGPFLMGLNAPQGPNGDEVSPNVKWMTIRSDRNDKYAQPDGLWLGAKGMPTHVGFDGPALKGAENVEIAGLDHRETAFSAKAFAPMLRFITGRASAAPIAPEARIVLDGKLSGYGVNNREGTAPSNLPLAGATVEVFAVDAETGARRGAAAHRRTVGADGAWGPFHGDSQTCYEFVIGGVPGYAVTHLYRSPFARSSGIVNLRAEPLQEADRGAAAVVTLVRPRGYFGLPRDEVTLDGHDPAPGIAPGTPGLSASKIHLSAASEIGRPVSGSFNGERITGRAWPIANREVTFLELTY
ncbi:MAG TPA: alpha/beta fold hydrolase [Burkholderiaceae bacterium]